VRYWQALSGPYGIDEGAFARDLADADSLHRRTGEPIEVPRRPGKHNGLWVYADGQRERFFSYPPRVTVLLPERRGYIAGD
jgi:hypothetical protein